MRFLSLMITVLFVTTSALAVPTAPLPRPRPQSPPNTVTINAGSLRNIYLSRNVGIAIALNDVQQAKNQVTQARANLLPSVSLGGVISGGPSFMLTTVSFLLPFLMPSNWLDLKESNYLLKSQGMSYYLAQLNGYASAYSLYQTIVGDIQLRAALQQQYENFKGIEDQLRLPAEMGMIRMEDYLQAQAQAKLAYVQVSQMDELIKREKAAVRQMLALPLAQDIAFEDIDVPMSPVEDADPQTLLDRVNESSPENQQLNYMITAAQYGKWSKAFSFLSGSSLGMNRPSTGGAFSDVTQTGSVNLGFGYFPALQLSNLQINQLRLRKQELRFDQAQLLEVSLGSLVEAQKQLDASVSAEDNLRKVYNAEYIRYQAGMTDILHVLDAGNQVTTAILSRVKASDVFE